MCRRSIERALTLAPEDHRVHRLRHQIYLLAENLEQAEAAAQQVLTLEGPSIQGYQDLATVNALRSGPGGSGDPSPAHGRR